MTPEVVIVGLGPGDVDLITSGTLDALAEAPAVLARTERHPACRALAGATFLDDVYETADTMDEVYATIVDRVVDAASSAGSAVYVVPGSPLVAERTVQLLLADDRVRARVLPALSFVDLAWVRLGVDPVDAGVRIVDGHRFAVDAAGQRGPLLVCQCDSSLVLSEIKLAVEDWPDAPVTVIQRLGLPDELITTVDWADLDRSVDADHLTSIYIPVLDAPVASELVRFEELVRTLRACCPWDRSQTHASLKRYLLEECYELLEAIDDVAVADSDDAATALCEELGDVLFQVVFHATIAAESGWFTLADVALGVHDKLRDRHPHVFGDAAYEGADQLAADWEARKQAEKERGSVMEGIPGDLPALLTAFKMLKKADAAGRPAELADLRHLVSRVDSGDLDGATLGQLLFAVVDVARRRGLDPEDELRLAARRFRESFDAATP